MALPQDTEFGLCSWSTMVLLLQGIGAFSYKVPKGNARKLEYSLPIFLWGVFICTLKGIVSFMMQTRIKERNQSPELIYTMHIYSVSGLVLSTTLVPIIMLAKSGHLTSIFEDLSLSGEGQIIQVPQGRSRFKRVQNYIVPGILIIMNVIFSFIMNDAFGVSNIFEAVLLTVISPLYAIGHYISTNLAEKLLNLLSRQLLTAVQVSLDTFSLITGGTDGDLRTEEDIMLSLHNLDCCVRSVRRGLQSVVRYYFPIFSLILISSAIAITVETYVLIRGFHFNGATVVLLMLSVALIAQLCLIAGNFLSEVDKAVDILMEVKCKTVNAALKARVSDVMSDLAGLQRFNVCGWYCLDYSTLLTLAHICLTNLIVLLQMAGLY